jgi:hypothetical protein
MELTTSLPAALSALADLGIHCALLFGAWTLAGTVAALVLGVGLGLLCARPLLRWGIGEVPLVVGIAVVMLAVCGGVGGLWAGMWAGTATCVDLAVDEQYLIEDLAVHGLIAAAQRGVPSEDPEENAARIREAVDEAGGSLQELLADIRIEIDDEALENLPEFLSPDIVPQLIEGLEKHKLFEPEGLAGIVAAGGFRQALADESGEYYDYANLVVETTEPLRRDVSLAIVTVAVVNAIIAVPFALCVPMLLIAAVAVIGRLIRKPGQEARS